ncbi:hypothetical protein EUX98_g5298 [Antrodiella citrinella]|uniref:Uncharacterized protein n=1 Tax=Antrodiella citrinella TaxID=2447956 RepID=A0A4S4MS22_9APHY|nr:hypothetical protein EUX98_g5298 [Antrodiella citrinella]
MPAPITPVDIFPTLTASSVLAFQFSSWYPRFASLSIKSTIIRPLSAEFKEYLDSEGVFLPEGSEDVPAESELSDDEGGADEDEDEDEEAESRKTFAFPELDQRIRDNVAEYGAVFPKLNFSSPRDAAWMLPASSPLKCTSPSEVYLLLKSSDFVLHDLDPDSVFEGVPPAAEPHPYELELVLRKWYPVERSRELRCFVRREMLIGVSQRDPNYYEFWNEASTRSDILDAVIQFWQNNVKGKWEASNGDYTFDLLLTRDLTRAHIIDFNPYAPRTNPILFTYNDLFDLLKAAMSRTNHDGSHPKPEFRVIDSRSHPAAARNAPAHQHNMVPIEALVMGNGRTVQEFSQAWEEEVRLAAEPK